MRDCRISHKSFNTLWYRAATEAKQTDPNPEIIKKRFRASRLPEKVINVILIRNPSIITFGTVEKNAVILITEPS